MGPPATNRRSLQWLAEGPDDCNRSPSVGACMFSAFHLSSTRLETGLCVFSAAASIQVSRFAHEQMYMCIGNQVQLLACLALFVLSPFGVKSATLSRLLGRQRLQSKESNNNNNLTACMAILKARVINVANDDHHIHAHRKHSPALALEKRSAPIVLLFGPAIQRTLSCLP